MGVDEFVEQHKYIAYCEAIILEDGSIEYATPSHQMKLLTLEGVPQKADYFNSPQYHELKKRISITADPNKWMTEDLNVVSVYYVSLLVPLNCTDAQIESIQKLIEHCHIDRRPRVEIASEKTKCKILESTRPQQEIQQSLLNLSRKVNKTTHKVKKAIEEVTNERIQDSV